MVLHKIVVLLANGRNRKLPCVVDSEPMSTPCTYTLGTINDLHLPSRYNVDLPDEAERGVEILFAKRVEKQGRLDGIGSFGP